MRSHSQCRGTPTSVKARVTQEACGDRLEDALRRDLALHRPERIGVEDVRRTGNESAGQDVCEGWVCDGFIAQLLITGASECRRGRVLTCVALKLPFAKPALVTRLAVTVCLWGRSRRLALVNSSLEGEGDYPLDYGILQDPVQGVSGAGKGDPLFLRAPEDNPVSAPDHRAGPHDRPG
jgi:hypothetical protein